MSNQDEDISKVSVCIPRQIKSDSESLIMNCDKNEKKDFKNQWKI